MSDRPTPETNALISVGLENADRECVPADFARKLERERDGAREHLREIKEYGTEEINAAVELRQKLARALVDLDNMQDQRDLAMKVIKRLECERDEAREAWYEMQSSFERSRDEVEKLIRERDEARKETEYYKERYEQLKDERDEAREELKNEMKWHHQTHKELVEAQCKLLDIEYDKLKS